MKAEVVQQYIDKQVQQMGDDTIQPIMRAIASETNHQIAIGETVKAAQAKAEVEMKESQTRMAKLQSDLTVAKANLHEFASNLSTNAEDAVTRK